MPNPVVSPRPTPSVAPVSVGALPARPTVTATPAHGAPASEHVQRPATAQDSRVRQLVQVMAARKQAEEAVDDWSRLAHLQDPRLMSNKALRQEYLALAQEIKTAIAQGNKTLYIHQSKVSHLPDAALTVFDTLEFKHMYCLKKLSIPAATPHAGLVRTTARKVHITGSGELTELAVDHPHCGAITVAISNPEPGVPPHPDLAPGELHIAIKRCLEFSQLDLSRTCATKVTVHSDVHYVHYVRLVAPPQLRVLRGRIKLGLDPEGEIFKKLLNNQALHLVRPIGRTLSERSRPRCVTAASVLCLGECLFLFDKLKGLVVEPDSGPDLSPALCVQQAVFRGIFGQILRECLGDSWVDAPGIEDADGLKPQEMDAKITAAHVQLKAFIYGENPGDHATYLHKLTQFLGDWLPLQHYIKAHSSFKHKPEAAGIRGLQFALNRLADSDAVLPELSPVSYKHIREEWIRTQLHVGYPLMPAVAPPAFVEAERISQRHSEFPWQKSILIQPISSYNAQALVVMKIQYEGEVQPMAAAVGPLELKPTPGGELVGGRTTRLRYLDFQRSRIKGGFSQIIFSLPPGTENFDLRYGGSSTTDNRYTVPN
jgi:hypothetical protein